MTLWLMPIKKWEKVELHWSFSTFGLAFISDVNTNELSIIFLAWMIQFRGKTDE